VAETSEFFVTNFHLFCEISSKKKLEKDVFSA
jgi:hypothetical protein